MLRSISLFTFLVILSSLGWARTDSKHMQLLIMPPSDSDTSVRNGESSEKKFSDRVLPKSLTSADSSQTVVSKIIDNSLAYWWDNSELKNTSMGQAATKIEENMKAEMDLGSSDSGKTDHKISLKVLAMQALAKIEYFGWTKAAINYDAKAAKAELEVFENLSNNKDLVVSHSVTAAESKSQLSLRWNW